MPILNWLGKEKVINHHRQVPYRILEPQYEYGQSDSGNMLIHGDNLDALKSLLPRYEGKVKLVYIDPPYNTGNEGWVYNDNVNDPKIRKWLGEVVGREGEDLSRHDKWLCMMYPRLRLLQRLLADDGSIFISIGDDENASLKMIMNEIFGAGNFIDTIIWQKIYTVKNSAKYFSGMHDYIIVYAKNKGVFNRNLLDRTDELDASYTNPDSDPRGPWTTNAVQARNYNGQGIYEIISPKGKSYSPPTGTYWRCSEVVFKELDADNRVWWGANGESIPRIKKFLSEVKQGIVPTTLWSHTDVGNNGDAKLEIRKILQDISGTFDTPKPVRLIERILQIATNPGDIVLDSFAGSGTTAHAVLKQNKRDGGNRRFILIECEDYAETITAERVKRVIDGYGEGKSAIPGLGGGFAYCELGDPLLLPDGSLNESLGAEKIREYVWHTETHAEYAPQDEAYLLGVHLNTAYYFHYEKGRVTALDHDFLHGVKTRAGGYMIYADINTLSSEEMDAANIRFKKIPRDIARL